METTTTLALFIVSALAGMGLILLGTRHLSDGLQILLGRTIRKTMNLIGQKPLYSIVAGGLSSLMIQSRISSSVMAVSYAGSGLMNLGQVSLFLAGTAVGTLLTPWLFILDFGRADLYLLALGVLPMLHARWDLFAGLGRIIFAFGLMLIGYDIISFGLESDIRSILVSQYGLPTEVTLFTYIVLIFLALVLSFLFRSTVALVALVIALWSSNIITFEVALALVIGFNLGATVPAFAAALRSNIIAKRGVFIYSGIYVLQVVLIALAFPAFTESVVVLGTFLGDPTGLPSAHVLFNLGAMLVGLVLHKPLVALSIKVLPKPKKKQPQHLQFFGRPSNLAPSLAIEQAHQEVKKLSALVHSMVGMTIDRFDNVEEETDKRVKKYESITDNILDELTVFLTKVMQATLTKKQSFEATCILQLAVELERLADNCTQIINFQSSGDVQPQVRDELKSYFAFAVEAYELVFPLITDQYNISLPAMNKFLEDFEDLVAKSIKSYDRMLEKGLRQHSEYETSIRTLNSIRRIIENCYSIVDLRKRFLVPEVNLDRV